MPWLIAPHTSKGRQGVISSAASFCSTMRPICGPLPWVSVTAYPAAIMSAMVLAVWRITCNCASAVGGRLLS